MGLMCVYGVEAVISCGCSNDEFFGLVQRRSTLSVDTVLIQSYGTPTPLTPKSFSL